MSEFSTSKLALFHDKFDALKRAYHGEIDETYPVSVELSLTDACNFKCVWCSDKELRKRLKGSMKRNALFSLLDDLSIGGTKGITIEGGGEPTLHPLLCDTISYIRDRGMSAGLITDGERFNYKEHLDDLEWVRISLDAVNSSQMDLLKKDGAFDKVMRIIEQIADIKKNTVLGISYIVTNKNRSGLEDMVQKLGDIGADYCQIKPVVDHPELKLGSDDSLKDLKRFEHEKFKVFLNALDDNNITGNTGLPCVANSITTVISANGNVYFCGRLNVDPEWPPLGNINKESFHEIWFGEVRKKQSFLMRSRENCLVRCPECRLVKFNVLLDNIANGAREPLIPKNIKTPNFI